MVLKKFLTILCPILFLFLHSAKASPGDSIFALHTIHNLYVTFPYSNFYDSLLWSHANDTYLEVDILFNNEMYHQVGIKAKGNSSFNGPSEKKSFKLDFNRFVSGQDIHGLKKLNFNNSFKDPSFMREKLANDFLIEHDLPAPRTTYCNVYFNNQLWGLYLIVEEIDDEFCTRWFGNNDENLFKGDPHGDLRWKGNSTQSLYETDYELENNSTSNNWSDLIGLIDIINNQTGAGFNTSLDSAFNTYRFIRHWAVMNLFSSLDSYIGSGHNYYIYHDSIKNRFEWIAWDNNETFGGFKMNLSTTQLKNLDIYYFSQPATSRPLVNNLMQNSIYKAAYNLAICELKQDFTNAKLDARIDSLRSVIQQSVYNDPKKFYSNSKFDSSFNYDVSLSGPGGMTVFGLKSFINQRQTAITNQLASYNIPCYGLGNSTIDIATFSIYPNPAFDWLYIDSPLPFEQIELFDLSGRCIEIRNYSTNTRNSQIPLGALSPGIYFLRIDKKFERKIQVW